MKFDKLVQEIFIDTNLFNGIGFRQTPFNPHDDKERIGKKITKLKGYDLYIKQGENHGNSIERATHVSIWKDNKNIIKIEFFPYGEKNTYKENATDRFDSSDLYVSDIYHYLITHLGWIIVSDNIHSERGAGVWKRLLDYPDIKFSFLDPNENPNTRKWHIINPKDDKQVRNLWTTDKKHEVAGIRIKAQKNV